MVMGWVMAPPVREMSALLGANGSMPQNARRFPGTFGLPRPRTLRRGFRGLEDHGDDAPLDGAFDDAK